MQPEQYRLHKEQEKLEKMRRDLARTEYEAERARQTVARLLHSPVAIPRSWFTKKRTPGVRRSARTAWAKMDEEQRAEAVRRGYFPVGGP